MKHTIKGIKATRLLVTVFMGLSLLSGYFASTPGLAGEPQRQQASDVLPPRPPPTESGHSYGYRPPRINLSHLTGQKPQDGPLLQTATPSLPARWDWRENHGVTPVKDQGQCGSCYAFAVIGSIEGKLNKDTSTVWDFSENNAKECNWYELTGNNGTGGDNCDLGGEFMWVTDLFVKKGLVLETDDPYVASDVACKSGVTYKKTLLDWRVINGNNIPPTTTLKSYIYQYGPVFTAFYAGSFTKVVPYYNGTYTFYYPTTPTTPEPDHAVVVVGWDDNLSYDMGGGQTGYGAWIVKNSWGTGWGNGGYFTIAYGSAQFGWMSGFAYELQDYDTNGSLMYYDEGGWTDSVGYDNGDDNKTAWGLAKFIPTANTAVNRVEFWTSDITSDIDIYLYDNFDGSTTSNILASKLNLSFTEAGYHSVLLDTPVPVTSGNDIIAVIKFTNQTDTLPVVIDDLGPHETARTYTSATGNPGTWIDEGTYSDDVGIRLRTSLPPVANFTSNVTSGVAPLDVIFTDQSSGTITSRAWSFGDGGTSIAQNPSHPYTTAGSYTVSLTVTGPGGTDTKTVNNYITVIQPTVANFTSDKTSGNAPLNVTFTDQSSGTIISRAWSFGDGGTSTAQNPSHPYTTAGSYTVSLTVSGPGGTDTKTVNNYITVAPGPLDHIVVSPNPAFLQASAGQQFTAVAYDQCNNPIPDLTYTWSVINGGGSISEVGLFTAGGTTGTFSNTVQAEASSGGITKQGKATVAIGASMTVTATLQGDYRTEAGMNVPLVLKLYDQAVTTTNIYNANPALMLNPVATFRTADGNIAITGKNAESKVITFTVGGLPTNTYNVTLYTLHCLVNLKSSVAIAQGASIDMGMLLEGDAQDITEGSKTIDVDDFTRFASAFEAVPTSPNWDERADFDRNNQVTVLDFSSFYTNCGKTSPQTV